jgi:hypothetical protein
VSGFGQAAAELRRGLLGLLARLDRPDADAEQLGRELQLVADASDRLCALVEESRRAPATEREACARAVRELLSLHAIVEDRARTQLELCGERIKRVRATRARLAPLLQPGERGGRVDLAG